MSSIGGLFTCEVVGQCGGEFAFELVLGFFYFAQKLFVFLQQHVGVVGFFFGGVGVFDVEVEDGPIDTVASGLGILGLAARPDGISERQALAAIGQASLAHRWQVALAAEGLVAAQVLLTNADFSDRARYLNLTAAFRALFAYAALFFVEAVGLWRQQRWAEWLTVIATATLIPPEIYECIQHPGATLFLLLAVNVAVVWLLTTRLRHELAQDAARRSLPVGAFSSRDGG